MKKRKCCHFGEHKCEVHVGNNVFADRCIADIVQALRRGGIETVASCCGHESLVPTISLKDGRQICVWNSNKKGRR